MNVQIDTPIQYIKGVGPHFAKVFEKRGIRTVGELLEWYPRAYEDRRAARSIATLTPGEIVSLKAQVVGVRTAPLGRTRKKMYDVIVRDPSGTIKCKYFRVPYRGYFDRFTPEKVVRVVGKVTEYRGFLEFHHPDIRDENPDEDSDAIIPLYTETEGLSPQRLRKLIESSFVDLKGQIPDQIPQWVRAQYKLLTREQALRGLHFPDRTAPGRALTDQNSPFHYRVIFEEFFWLQLHLATRQAGILRETAPAIEATEKNLEPLIKKLPFELTNAQKLALDDILRDMSQPHPMHRLVQGDVGSGKTIVALLACALAAQYGYQSALMAPTEILAEQHLTSARRFLEPFGIKVGILTGHMTQKERRETLDALKNGEIKVCVGTHALIQDDVEFQRLALVIVDEQHRFGVQQRQTLKKKGVSPHFLVMTATPIPRTLAMTVYGDLDVSVINELPKGRIPIKTRVTYPSKRPVVLEYIAEQIRKGRQAYVIYPLVEESEKLDLKNAVTEYERLCHEFPQFKLGLLHGRMKSDEKDEIMNRFRKGEIQILVSTTVIEVGVDVPNATLVMIEHAERFGLSQLHQIRGRVGRGIHQSVCILMMGHAVSDEARARCEIMEKTNDGFKIAEADLEIRGPGEFLGARQSGLPGFRMANLVRDVGILQSARAAAFEILKTDPRLEKSEHEMLRQELKRQYGADALASVG